MEPRMRSINLYVPNKLERNDTEWTRTIDYQNHRNKMIEDTFRRHINHACWDAAFPAAQRTLAYKTSICL